MTGHQPPTVSLTVRRRFNAAPEVVFDAWLDPHGVGRWLFSTPDGRMERVEIDARVGGTFVVVERRGAELAEHFGRYVEIDRARRLAFDFWTSDAERPTRVTIEIEPEGGGCVLTLTHEIDAAWASFGDKVRDGWTMILDGLAPVASPGDTLLISRSFSAPRALVWSAWTDRERIVRWCCPKDFGVLFAEADVRPGGRWSTGMLSPDGTEHVAVGEYREIDPPRRLVFTHGWEGGDGPETLVTLHLMEHEGRTFMTFVQSGFATTESRDGHTSGWSEAFENLRAHVEGVG